MQELDGTLDPQHQLPINQGRIPIKSAFFEGVMEIHLRGLPNTQQQIFEGKKRFFQVMCQVCAWTQWTGLRRTSSSNGGAETQRSLQAACMHCNHVLQQV
jgi:hypothetical protein